MYPNPNHSPTSQILSLTTTSINNVVISNPSDIIYYEVVTPKWTPNATRISRMDPNSREMDVVAEVVAEEHKRPVVRLRGEQFHPAEDFVGLGSGALVGNACEGIATEDV